MFIEELPPARERIVAAARDGDHEAARAELHKLRSSCGFVGAARLGDAVQALQSRIDDAGALARFDRVALSTLAQSDAADQTPDYA